MFVQLKRRQLHDGISSLFLYILLFVPFLIFASYVFWRIFLNYCISFCAWEYGAPAGAHSLMVVSTEPVPVPNVTALKSR